MRLLASLLIATVFLAGCGGGGNSGISSRPINTVPPPINGVRSLVQSTRFILPGDRWAYRTAIRDTVTGVISDGTSLIKAEDGTGRFPGMTNLVELGYEVEFATGFDFGALRYFRSSDNRDFSMVGSGNALNTPLRFLPGIWTLETEFAADATAPGNPPQSFHSHLKVLGTEQVTVPAGTFETWKCEVERDFLPQSQSGIFWFAPQIGSHVKAVYRYQPSTGNELEIAEELTSASML